MLQSVDGSADIGSSLLLLIIRKSKEVCRNNDDTNLAAPD